MPPGKEINRRLRRRRKMTGIMEMTHVVLEESFPFSLFSHTLLPGSCVIQPPKSSGADDEAASELRGRQWAYSSARCRAGEIGVWLCKPGFRRPL
jgi:uncharacterized cupin superfamily protein